MRKWNKCMTNGGNKITIIISDREKLPKNDIDCDKYNCIDDSSPKTVISVLCDSTQISITAINY